MARPDLKSRFDEVVTAAKRDTLLAAVGSVFLGVVLVPALGLLLYIPTVHVSVYVFRDFPIGPLAFVGGFSVVLLAIGFWQSRTHPLVRLPPVGERPADPATEDGDGWDAWLHPAGYQRATAAGVFVWWAVARGILSGFPRFSYDLLGNVLRARSAFRDTAARDAAFELLTSGERVVDRDAIDVLATRHPKLAQSALVLLSEAGLVRRARREEGWVFQHTTKAVDMLQ